MGRFADTMRLPDGRRAHLWQGGSATGPVVFFFHGCPDSRLAARTGTAAARRCGVRLIAVNRPGYGESDTTESNHVSVAEDTAAIADTLGIERFAVLGMSLGGAYALACAARVPDRVTAIGVVASPVVPAEHGSAWHRDRLSATQRAFFATSSELTVERAMEVLRPEFESYVATLNPLDEDDVAVARRWTAGLPDRDARLLAAVPPTDLAAQAREALAHPEGYLRDAAVTFRPWGFDVAEVSAPTSLWYGGLDSNAAVRNGEWLADHIPRARLVVREQSTHLATLLEYWDDILGELRDAGPNA